jgi:hypothetical protein
MDVVRGYIYKDSSKIDVPMVFQYLNPSFSLRSWSQTSETSWLRLPQAPRHPEKPGFLAHPRPFLIITGSALLRRISINTSAKYIRKIR